MPCNHNLPIIKCKICKSIRRKNYYIKHKSISNIKSREWKNNQLLNGKCQNCVDGIIQNNNVHCKTCLNKRQIYKLEIKLKCIKLYGSICEFCKTDQVKILTIHHVNNNGNVERKILKCHGGTSFYSKILKSNQPRNDLKLLCFNCNIRMMPKIETRASRWQQKQKKKAIETYGNTCAKCNESDIRCLTIDHVENNGNKDRKALGSGINFYRALNKLTIKRTDLQVLCFNCNESKIFKVTNE